MISPYLRKIPTNSWLRTPSLHRCTAQHIYTPLSSLSLLHSHSHRHFTVETTKGRQAAILARQKKLQQAHLEAAGAGGQQQLRAVYPGELSDDEDEYVPEVDWDHTRFESHYKRIWAEEPEPESRRERIYNAFLKFFVMGTWVVGAGCFLFGCFAWYKMKKQLRYVRGTQRSIRFMRKIYDANLSTLLAMVPLDLATMDVTELKAMLLPFCDVDESHLTLSSLNKCAVWAKLCELGLPLNDIIDYDGDETMDVEDVTYFIAMLHYFLGQQRRKGTPSVRRKVRDDVYAMLASYSEDGTVRLKNMGSYACACFSLAIISPPNLGDETIGGQTLDEFKVNYCKYMLRDEEMGDEDVVTVRKFNFIYKICDFSIGLTPETRGQLSK